MRIFYRAPAGCTAEKEIENGQEESRRKRNMGFMYAVIWCAHSQALDGRNAELAGGLSINPILSGLRRPVAINLFYYYNYQAQFGWNVPADELHLQPGEDLRGPGLQLHECQLTLTGKPNEHPSFLHYQFCIFLAFNLLPFLENFSFS
jgi:hypothetical protein